MQKKSQYLAKNLRYLRKQKELRQEEISFHLGCSDSTWSNYEKGNTIPSLDCLVFISSFFGITLDELVLQDLEKRDLMETYLSPHVNDSMIVVSEGEILYIRKELERLMAEVVAIKQRKL